MALAPLLAALLFRGRAASARDGSRGAFGLGLATGLTYFVGTIYWTALVMGQYGDISLAVAVLLMILLAAYLAIYPALFAVIVDRLVARFGARGLVLAPAVWVTTELGRGYMFTGFPWVLLGYSQVTVLPVAQLASVFGVWGVSALVTLVSVAIVLLVLERGALGWTVAAVAAAAVIGTAGWGSVRIADSRLTRDGVVCRVGLVQGNVPQDEKWDQARAGSVVQRYLSESRRAAALGARFIVWPESALPFLFQEEPVVGDQVRQLAFQTRTSVLFGSDQVERGTPPRAFNSAFLVDEAGTVAAVYRKMHLVPFGEYVPVKKLLFFAGPLVQAVSDFSEGDRVVMLPVAGHHASTAICYEVVYPNLARDAVLAGSELLTTITNDAWFGRSSAAWQHFDMASMRAIEQGRYLARSANTGISGVVDPYGRVLARTELFVPATTVADVRFLTGQTVYGRIGDVFVYGCALLTIAGLVATRLLRRARP